MSPTRALLACAALLAASLQASAQEGGDTAQMQAALAAGYKAAFVCSATFTAGQSMAEIEANELSGIYPDYREAFEAVSDPVIDDDARTVSVSYPGSLPPRIAAWRPGLGCVQLPIGAHADAIEYLPGFTGWTWPDGLDDSSVIGANVRMTFPVHVTDQLEAPISFAFDGATYGEGTRTSAGSSRAAARLSASVMATVSMRKRRSAPGQWPSRSRPH